MLTFLLGIIIGAVSSIAAMMCLYDQNDESFWTELNQKIYKTCGQNAKDIAQDIIVEFNKKYPTSTDILKGISYQNRDYPTITIEMNRPIEQIDDVVTMALLHNRELEKALTFDQPQKAELIYIRFTDTICSECGYLCPRACDGLGHYQRYWVDFQFPHLDKEIEDSITS